MAASSPYRVWALLFSFFLTRLISGVTASPSYSSFVLQGGSPNNVTVAVNVPSNSTQNDLFFHVNAPAGQQWTAFGFGNSMSGSLIFVAYIAQDGSNITLSPRLASGHSMPTYTSDVKVNVLPGSGVVDGVMVINAQCTNCRSWNGGQGTLNVQSTSQPMIWAVGPQDLTFTSNDVNARISQHADNGMGTFSLDMVKATGEGGVPVISADSSNSSNNANPNGDVPGPRFADGDGDLNGFPVAIHAFLCVAAFLVIFPGGYMFLRVFERVWVHAGIQVVGMLFATVGIVTGIVLTVKDKINPSFNDPHQVIGFIVLFLIFFSFVLGLSGHMIFKKTQTPAIPMKIHKIVGPLTITLGLVNACLGFRFAGNPRHIIGFVIISTLMVIFVTGIVMMVKRRKMRKAAHQTPAAANFRSNDPDFNNNGYYPPPPGMPQGNAAPPAYVAGYYAPSAGNPEHGVPMQTFASNQHPNSNGYKAPQVNVQQQGH